MLKSILSFPVVSSITQPLQQSKLSCSITPSVSASHLAHAHSNMHATVQPSAQHLSGSPPTSHALSKQA
jgi:hypothetical protein